MNTVTTSKRATALRLLAAGALVVAMVNCGGSSDSSGNRNRNAALDGCSTDSTVASDSSTPVATDNSGNCSPDTTFASQSDSNKVTCDVTWDPATKAVTFCDNFTRFDVAQYDEKDQLIAGTDQSYKDDKGGNQITVETDANAKRLEVKVFAVKDGSDTQIGKVDFTPSESGKSSFKYEQSSTDTTVAASDTSVPTSDSSAPSVDSTVPAASDSTVPASDSTAVPATVAPEPPVQTIVERERCDFTYVAATKSIKSCKAFDRFSVATYGTDGKYSGRFEGQDDTVQIPDNITSNNGLGFAHFEVATDIDSLNLELYIADGWINIGDGTKDVTTTALLENKDQPTLSTYGNANTESMATDGTFMIFSRQFMIIDRDGTPVRNERMNYDPSVTSTWRAFLPDGFGIGRYVASGVVSPNEITVQTFTVYDPLEMLSTQTVEVATGQSGDGMNQFVDDVISTADSDPCIGISPVLIMTPQSPSGSNRVTVSMDSDCASSKHFMGVVIAAKSDFLSFWWEDLNVTYASFLTTRYSTRIDESIYLPDGDYIIMFGSLGSLAFTDYTVNGQGSRADCNSAHVRVMQAKKIAQLEGCTAGDLPWVSFSVSDIPFTWGMEVPLQGNNLDLGSVPYSGYFYAMAVGFQDVFWGFYTPFLMCIRNCDSPPGDTASFDLTNYSANGTIVATDNNCTDGTLWNEALYWHQYKSSYAFEYTTSGRVGEPTVVHRNGKNVVQFYCVSNGANGYSESLRAVSLNITKSLPPAPSNDDFADAAVINPNEWTYASNVNASSEEGEPVTAWMGNNPHIAQASVWYKYTPTKDQWVNIYVDRSNFASMFRVFRGSKVDRLGYVTGRYCDMWWNDLCWDQFGFGAKAGNTYYVQVAGEWHTEQGVAAVMLSASDQQPAAPDTTVPGQSAGADTTVPAPDTTVATDITTGTVAPDTTVPTSSSAPDTTAVTQNSAAPDTTAVTQSSAAPDTTVATSNDAKRDQALNETFVNAAHDASNNETVSAAAPVNDQPASLEIRENTTTVEVPTIDMWASLETGGVKVAKNKPVTVYIKNQRPIRVRPNSKTVSIPVGTDAKDMTVVATSTDGKTITSTLQVKRVLKPIFKVGNKSSSGSSSTTYIIVAIVVLLLLAGGYVVMTRKKEDEAEA